MNITKMKMYPINFFDKNDALRAGLTDDKSWEENGVWILYQGERSFMNRSRIRLQNKVKS